MILIFYFLLLNSGVFWLNIAKNEVYCCYRHCSKLFSGERLNFSNIVAEIVRKVWERRKMSDVMGREKKMNFDNEIIEIHVLPSSCPWSAPPVHAKGIARIVYQLWQSSCRNCRELREKIWIVATKLPKMGGKKKVIVVAKILGRNKKKKMLRPQYFHNKSQVISCY